MSNIHIYFLFNEEFSPELLKDLIEYCFDNGCKPGTPSQVDSEIIWYSSPETNFKSVEGDIHQATGSITKNNQGAISFFYKEVYLSFRINISSEAIPSNSSNVSISIDSSYLNHFGKPADKVEANAGAVFDFCKLLLDFCEPVDVFGDVAYELYELESYKPDKLRICWMTYFPSDKTRKFGKEKLLSAPAWRVEEVGDGVLMVLTPNPLDAAEVDETREEVRKHLGLPV